MNLYCPKCQNLIEKIDETMAEGKELNRMCQRCEKLLNFVVKYKVIESTKREVDRNGKSC